MLQLQLEIKELLDEVRLVRRDLHKIPEVAFEEFKTMEYIAKYLDALNVSYEKNIVGTGVIAYFPGKAGGNTLAFRADMDALSVNERNEIEFASNHAGVMHACGHDGHMAILLVFAKCLSQMKESIKDNIVLIFQPAEEGPGGALPIITEGYLSKYGVKEIYGLHLFPQIEEGRIGVRSGPMMSQTGEFDIIIHSKSGHGAMPHVAIDGVVIAAEMVSGLQTIASRSINPIDPAVLTIGRLYGGERRNVIAKEVVLEGTIRSFKQEVFETIKNRMADYKEGLEKTHKCKIDLVFRDMYPAVTNDDFLTSEFIKCSEESINIIDPIMLAEDFSYFQKEVPGVFFFLGCKNDEENYCQPLHSDKFNFNERALVYGIQAYVNIIKQRGAIE